VTTVGDSTGFPIWVPDDTTALTPLRTPFVTLANSIATQFGHLKAQSVSSLAQSDKIAPASGWTFSVKTTTVTAEIIATIYMEFHKNSGTLVTDTSGNVTNTKIANLDTGYPPQQPVPLSSGANGRGAFGYLNTAGEVYITAVAGSADVTSSTGLSLGGTFPLANPVSSGL
jgi:hypothetical protein